MDDATPGNVTSLVLSVLKRSWDRRGERDM